MWRGGGEEVLYIGLQNFTGPQSFIKSCSYFGFIQTFLSSLVGKQLLQYNLRIKRWEWNIDEILAEDITLNVLDLISAKMNELSEDIRVIISLVPFSSRARYLTDFIFVPNIFTLHIYRAH